MKIITLIETSSATAADDAMAKAWLQHVRDFDVAHPQCKFQILMQEGETLTLDKAIEMLGDVRPSIPLRAVIKNAKTD